VKQVAREAWHCARAGGPSLLLSLLLLLLVGSVAGQGERGSGQRPAGTVQPQVELPADFAALLRRLGALGSAPRTALLRQFISVRETAGRGDELDTLRARVLLGEDHQQRLAAAAAQVEFARVVRSAPATERDLCARALYGVCQTAELLGQTARCKAALVRLQRDFRDLRYGRFASATAARLEQKQVVRIGAPAPQLAPLLDLTGRPRAPRLRPGEPSLLLFIAPGEPRHVARAEKLMAAWRAGGGAPEALIVLAVDRDLAPVRAVVQRRKWTVPVVHCGGEFLTTALLQFGVQALPDSFLIGPDGTLLLRSPRPSLLREAAAALKSGG
jgi:hypothetical protein